MILLDSKPNLFKLRLASKKKYFFYLNYDENEGARIYVTVNKHKMYLDKMSYNLKWNFRYQFRIRICSILWQRL
jgi:hypothetical protein